MRLVADFEEEGHKCPCSSAGSLLKGTEVAVIVWAATI